MRMKRWGTMAGRFARRSRRPPGTIAQEWRSGWRTRDPAYRPNFGNKSLILSLQRRKPEPVSGCPLSRRFWMSTAARFAWRARPMKVLVSVSFFRQKNSQPYRWYERLRPDDSEAQHSDRSGI